MLHQGTSLQEKVERSRERLQRIASDNDPSTVYVAWTGGKDSSVVLWLWRTVLRELFPDNPPLPQALRVTTGLEFSEIESFCRTLVQEWGVAEIRAWADTESAPEEPGRDAVTCCRKLKIEPLRGAVSANGAQVLLTGLRQDEHSGRSERSVFETRKDPHYLQANPILEWTEMDIWSLVLSESMPYCSLYEQGYRSLDCSPCTARSEIAERGGRNPDKEQQMEILRSMGYF